MGRLHSRKFVQMNAVAFTELMLSGQGNKQRRSMTPHVTWQHFSNTSARGTPPLQVADKHGYKRLCGVLCNVSACTWTPVETSVYRWREDLRSTRVKISRLKLDDETESITTVLLENFAQIGAEGKDEKLEDERVSAEKESFIGTPPRKVINWCQIHQALDNRMPHPSLSPSPRENMMQFSKQWCRDCTRTLTTHWSSTVYMVGR